MPDKALQGSAIQSSIIKDAKAIACIPLFLGKPSISNFSLDLNTQRSSALSCKVTAITAVLNL